MPETTSYQWIQAERYDALTLALIEGASQDAVITAYGGDPASSEVKTFDEARNSFEPGAAFQVQTLTVASLVVAIENNGYHGSYPEVILKAIGQNGRFTSVKWSTTGGYYLLSVVNGAIEADFDALSLASGGDGDGTVPSWARAVPWSLDTAKATCVALMATMMGVPIEQQWFTTPQRTTVIPALEE